MVRTFFANLLALLRELSDENAYARYLHEHGTQHSGSEWRRFCDQRFAAKYRKAKCC